MDVIFKIKAYCQTQDLLDFIIVTFKPTKIQIDKGGFGSTSSNYTFTMTEAEPISPSLIEKELKDFLIRKGSQPDNDFLQVWSIEYTPDEKKRIESIITYGKLLPGKSTS